MTQHSSTRTCPACGAQAVPIIYGLPGDPALISAEQRGEAVFAGCLAFPDPPDWHCQCCGHEWAEVTTGR